MGRSRAMIFVGLVAAQLQLSFGAVQQLQQPSKQPPKQDGGALLPHFEPMVAVFCPEDGTTTAGGQPPPYFNRFMSPGGQWLTDSSPARASSSVSASTALSCPTRDKVSILEYCKKVYPEREITNIVEAGHYIKLTGWCRRDNGGGRCDAATATTQWVKPYRCLEGPFQSDALLVPEHCLFDHVHNQSRCANFDQWNRTATEVYFYEFNSKQSENLAARAAKF